ncbi:MAG: hypothetical protein R3F61_17235 [Myxococcota bacterium]
MLTAFVVALIGCAGSGPELMLDGADHVRVERLGMVDGPSAALSDGSAPDGVEWSVESSEVARVEEGRVIAQGAGTTTVTGSWKGQSVSWALEVVPELVVRFERVPAEVNVGQTHTLHVLGELGGVEKTLTDLTFVSSDPAVLTIDDAGTLVAVGEGLAYVTVTVAGGKAMAEIAVTPAE